jgi:hypothetical protein
MTNDASETMAKTVVEKAPHRSLRGVLAGWIKRSVPLRAWRQQREDAWRQNVGDRIDAEPSGR